MPDLAAIQKDLRSQIYWSPCNLGPECRGFTSVHAVKGKVGNEA